MTMFDEVSGRRLAKTEHPKAGMSVLWAGVAAIALAAGPPAIAAPTQAQALSRQPLKMDPAWRGQVQHIAGAYVRPVAVSVEGPAADVSRPNGLLGRGGTTLRATSAGGARLIVDLGRLASGFVEIGVRDARGGPLRLAYAEGRAQLGPHGDGSDDPTDFFYRGQTLAVEDDPDGRTDLFQPPSGAKVLTSPGLRGSQRYIAISLEGPGSVTIDFVRVRQTNLIDAYDGHFLSSDAKLNKAWYASAYALELSTARDLRKTPGPWMIMDGPKRDRVAYAADLAFVALSAYRQSDAYRTIVRDSINLFACRQFPDGTFPSVGMIGAPCPLGDPGPPVGVPPGYLPGPTGMVRLDSFSAWWVSSLADYVRFTGDKDFAAHLLPTARRMVAFLDSHADAGGLFRTDNYDHKLGFNWHTPDKATGVGAYDNESYYAALQGMAALERSVAHDTVAADSLDARAEKLRGAILARLWDPDVGALRLNLDDPKKDHSGDANAFALSMGLLDAPRAKQAISFIDTHLGRPFGVANSEYGDNPYMTQYMSPYVMANVAMGRFRYGDGAGALDLIRRAWPHMIDNGPGTPWEEVSVTGGYIVPRGAGSPLAAGGQVGLAHAWSTVVPALSTYVLGVQPVDDGFRTWSVDPQPVDLAWAQGAVPTPHGPLTVLWRRGQGDRSFVLTVEAPAGTRGDIAVPLLGARRTIAMDGKIIWSGSAPMAGVSAMGGPDAVIVKAVQGRHTLAWTR